MNSVRGIVWASVFISALSATSAVNSSGFWPTHHFHHSIIPPFHYSTTPFFLFLLKGYMSEAVATILRFGFEELRATKILACHATWNTASEKVLCNNGMTFLKHIPQGYQKKGQWVPENLLAITAPAWRASQQNLP